MQQTTASKCYKELLKGSVLQTLGVEGQARMVQVCVGVCVGVCRCVCVCIIEGQARMIQVCVGVCVSVGVSVCM